MPEMSPRVLFPGVWPNGLQAAVRAEVQAREDEMVFAILDSISTATSQTITISLEPECTRDQWEWLLFDPLVRPIPTLSCWEQGVRDIQAEEDARVFQGIPTSTSTDQWCRLLDGD